MRTILLLLCAVVIGISAIAQPSLDKVMEKRAREMHRVILLNDKTAWETFVRENYSQSLIDKPMRAQVSSSVNGATATSESKTANSIHEKAMLFERLHNDFGDSKVSSLTPTGDTMEMVLQNSDGLTGTFSLKFQTASPHLIDGLGVNVVKE